MIAYKLTDSAGFTRKDESGETLWRVGSIVSPTGKGTEPCGPGVLHAYSCPLTAVFMDPHHADYGETARLFEIESDVPWETDGLKRWTTGKCRILRELELPRLSRKERIATAIILAPHPSTQEWAIKWLLGEDRTKRAAEKVWVKARTTAAARAAVWSAAGAPSESASAAAWAAVDAASAFEAFEEFEAKIPRAVERARKILNKEIPAERAWDALTDS